MSVKFETNVPITLYFPFGDAQETNGQYGPQFQYTVKRGNSDAGQKDTLYASPALHQRLQGAAYLCPEGTLKGYALIITKKEVPGNKKTWELCWANGVPVELPAGVEEPDAPAPTAPTGPAVPPVAQSPPPLPAAVPPVAAVARPAPAPVTPRPTPVTTAPPETHRGAPPPVRHELTMAEGVRLLTEAIHGAMKACVDGGFEPSEETIQKLSTTLFIWGAGHGLTARGAAPAPPPPTDDDLPF